MKTAKTEFKVKKIDILTQLNQITKFVETWKGTSEEEINWAHVGTLGHFKVALKELIRSVDELS